MKRFLSIISVVALVALALVGCRKDPIEFNQVGVINMQLVKGFSHKNKVQSKGIWDTFEATVTIIYQSGEDVVYNCVFSDPTGSGVYSNDNTGDRIYIIRNMNFRIRIEGSVDGESVSGVIPEAETEWLIFTDDTEELNVPPVMLYAGKTRLGIMIKEVGGDYVHAYAKLAEYEQPDSGIYEEVWGGFYYIEKKFADLNVSLEEWNFYPVENYGHDQEVMNPSGVFEGFISDLALETEYSIKAYASMSDIELFSRTVDIKTGSTVDSIMTLVTTELNAGVDFASIRGRIYMKEGYDLSNVNEVGVVAYPVGSPDSERWFYGELDGEDFYVNMSELEENTEYKYYLFAYYYDGYSRTCKSVESSFATEGSRTFVVNTGRYTINGVSDVSAVLYGEIVSGNIEYSSEIGFYFGRSADDMTEFVAGEIVAGQNTFTATLSGNNLGAGSTIYYCAVVKVEYNGELNEYKGSNMNFTMQRAPELTCSQPTRRSTYSFDIPCNINHNGRTCSEYGFLYRYYDYEEGGDPQDSLPDIQYNDGVSSKKTFTSSVSGNVTLTLNGLSVGNGYAYCLYAKYGDEYVYSDVNIESTYEIGGDGRYGVVFYAGTDFTLEAIIEQDQGTSDVVWGETGELVITTDVPSSGSLVSGLSNTEAIIAHYGLVDTYAAPACRIAHSGSYLPSAAEMEALARVYIEGDAEMIYLQDGSYWTSDEVDADNAKVVTIDSSAQTPTYTTSTVSKQQSNVKFVSVYRY